MKLLFALLLTALPLAASPMATATWVQLNTLADAQSFTYELVDGTTRTPLESVVCAVASGVTACHAPAPLPSSGAHAFTVVASSPDASRRVAVSVLLSVQAGAPNGFRVTITPIPATGESR